MKNCKFFCKDINFEPDRILPCCIGGENIPSLPFHGGPLDMGRYRDFVACSLAALQQDASICRRCPHLVETEGELPVDPGAQVLFRNVNINHHRHYCNCRCVYCPFWDKIPAQKMYAIRPVLESLVDQQALHPSCCIGWGGGESTILPDFEETSLWLGRLGYPQYVHTNALLLSEAVQVMLRKNRGRVNISLDSFDRASYQNIKGVDGWDKVLNTIQHYRAACHNPDQLEIKYIIFEKNNAVRDIQRFFQVVHSLDIHHVQYSFHGDEMTGDRIGPKTMLSAAFFVRMARDARLACRDFYLPESYSRQIEQMSRDL